MPMNALKISLIIVASLLLLSGAGYLYASSGVKSKSGYAKLVTPHGPSVNTLISVNIGPGGVAPTRWLAGKIMEASDSEQEVPALVAKRLLNQLEGLQLRVYEVSGNRQSFDNAIAESVTLLKQKSWETMATIRDGDEHIVVMHTGDDEQINGVSIMVSTQDKAVFVNLIGPFDPQSIADAVSQIK